MLSKKLLAWVLIFGASISLSPFVQAGGVKDYVFQIEAFLDGKPDTTRTKVLDLFWNLEKKTAKKEQYGSASFLQQIRRDLIKDAPEYPSYLIHDDHLGITFTKVPGFTFIYEPEIASTVAKEHERYGFATTINGSYFSRQEGGKYHAGLLYQSGTIRSPFVSQDDNISHVVCLKANGAITLIENPDFFSELLLDCTSAFQSGPLVLQNSQWYSRLSASTFDSTSHERTLLLLVDSERWFVTVRTKQNLWDIGRYVMSMPEFFGKKVTLLNLDGGSSVAYKSSEFPELNYGTTKNLPILLGAY